MKRWNFIKSTVIGGLAATLIPDKIFAIQMNNIPDEELLGKTNLSFRDENIKLRNEAYECFQLMKDKAKKSNIEIKVVSAFRSFEDQKKIWNRKYLSYTKDGLSEMEAINKIVEYSTMPGTSRHHWGTDIDLIDGAAEQPTNVLSPSHFEGKGVFANFKKWMDNNSEEFGFYLVYTDDPERKGFKFEPWHFSYKPLSQYYLKQYTERKIFKLAKNSDIEGALYLSEDFLGQYYRENILDINPLLL